MSAGSGAVFHGTGTRCTWYRSSFMYTCVGGARLGLVSVHSFLGHPGSDVLRVAVGGATSVDGDSFACFFM